jgi:hypothetical protein
MTADAEGGDPGPFFKPSAMPAGSRIGESQRREEGAPDPDTVTGGAIVRMRNR